MEEFKSNLITESVLQDDSLWGVYNFNFLPQKIDIQYCINVFYQTQEISPRIKIDLYYRDIYLRKLEQIFVNFVSTFNEIEYLKQRKIISQLIVDQNVNYSNNEKRGEQHRLYEEIELSLIEVNYTKALMSDMEHKENFKILNYYDDPKHEYDYTIVVEINEKTLLIEKVYLEGV
ncbi:hypothetical protein [Epilithonimonas sp.]|uniref:hypothetical protein n=1 Tax=Epilithonimonas sp. TaxID=2894511 RepID=UPI0035B2CC36